MSIYVWDIRRERERGSLRKKYLVGGLGEREKADTVSGGRRLLVKVVTEKVLRKRVGERVGFTQTKENLRRKENAMDFHNQCKGRETE